ncbi:hypothetical protein ACF08W_18640 [Streptomyces sp. NPDC015144]|uniref:hypothetical protein n=1 Tax=Streptomyces sp. NPDC015144 TaxID=3364944 RepID=UPI0036F8660C
MLVTTGIKRHYAAARETLRLRPHAAELPARTGAGPLAPAARTARAPADREPEEIRHLSVVAVATLDLAAMRTLAYAASLGQPVLAVHMGGGEPGGRLRRGQDADGAWPMGAARAGAPVSVKAAAQRRWAFRSSGRGPPAPEPDVPGGGPGRSRPRTGRTGPAVGYGPGATGAGA